MIPTLAVSSTNAYVIIKKRTLVPRTNWYGFENDMMALRHLRACGFFFLEVLVARYCKQRFILGPLQTSDSYDTGIECLSLTRSTANESGVSLGGFRYPWIEFLGLGWADDHVGSEFFLCHPPVPMLLDPSSELMIMHHSTLRLLFSPSLSLLPVSSRGPNARCNV
jgi:hypothetical protein